MRQKSTETVNATLQIDRLLPAWERFRAATDIGPIRGEAHYARMAAALEHLLDAAAGDESHPAMALADIVGDLIGDYEARRHPLPEATGVQALEFLMRQHRLRQVRALAARFGVAAATFI